MKKIVIILISVLVINAAKAQLITVYRCNFSNGYVGFNTMAKANAYCAWTAYMIVLFAGLNLHGL